jgi:MFS transporter, DHA1 family, inner membrane transport protein
VFDRCEVLSMPEGKNDFVDFKMGEVASGSSDDPSPEQEGNNELAIRYSRDSCKDRPTAPSKVVVGFSIFTLASGAFSAGTYEFLLTGLYNKTQEKWNLTETEAAHATTVFMAVSCVSPLIHSLVPAHWNKKAQLAFFQGLLTVSSIISALAPEYWVLLSARALAAVAHSPYTALGIATSVGFAPNKQQAGRFISYFLAGWVAANVIGIPMCTYYAMQLDDWRRAYWPMAVVSLIVAITLAALLPTTAPAKDTVTLKDKWGALKKSSVWGALVVAGLGYGGVFGCHTFYSWIMTSLAGYAQGDIPWLAIGWGLAVTVGNFVGGALADKSVLLSIFFLLPALAAVLTAFTFLAENKVGATFCLHLNGLVGFSLVTPLFRYITGKVTEGNDLSEAIKQAREGFGSSLSMSILGVGIVIAVALAQFTVDKGLGFESANWVGASLTGIAYIVFLATECKAVIAEFQSGCKQKAPALPGTAKRVFDGPDYGTGSAQTPSRRSGNENTIELPAT